MSLLEELTQAPETQEGVKEIPEGKYQAVTSSFSLEKSNFHKGQVLAGFIEIPGVGKSPEYIDLQNPTGRAQAVKQLSGILKNGLKDGKLPEFMTTEKDETIQMAKLAKLLSDGVPVHVEIKHKKDRKTGEKSVSDKGYTRNWNNFNPLAEGQEPLDLDQLPF